MLRITNTLPINNQYYVNNSKNNIAFKMQVNSTAPDDPRRVSVYVRPLGSRIRRDDAPTLDRFDNRTNNNDIEELIELLRRQDTDKFLEKLASVTDINAAANISNETLLEIATACCNVKAVEEILKFPDVDVNKKANSVFDSPLEMAKKRSCLGTTKGEDYIKISDMIENYRPGVDRRGNSDDEYTKELYTLLWANKTDDFIRKLADCKNINAKVEWTDLSLLMLAAKHGDVKSVEAILKFPDVDINAKDARTCGQTALNIANEGIQANRFGTERRNNYATIADMIKNYRPGIDRRNEVKPSQEETAGGVPMETIILMLSSSDAAMKQYALDNLIKYIDSDSFNPEYKDKLGRDVIHLSLISKDEKIKTVITKALQKGININSTNPSGQTCLIQAIKNLTIADKDEEKMTALSIIKFILDKNPLIDLQDKNGMSAFHYACMASSEPLLELILSANPNVLLKDFKGRIGIELTKSEKLKEIYLKHLLR